MWTLTMFEGRLHNIRGSDDRGPGIFKGRKKKMHKKQVRQWNTFKYNTFQEQIKVLGTLFSSERYYVCEQECWHTRIFTKEDKEGSFTETPGLSGDDQISTSINLSCLQRNTETDPDLKGTIIEQNK